jgi:anti-sigma factor ChrR (cupin superfamily)
MPEGALLPDFIRDAFEADGVEDAAAARFEAERAFGSLLQASLGDIEPPVQPSARLLARLEHTLAEPPFRYAPFFSQAAQLLDLPEPTVIEQLRRLVDPNVWRFSGLPGVQHVSVAGGPRVANAETLFVRFEPGVRFPEHHHTGLEQVLVLEGSYRDSTGVEHRPGELREWAAGSSHAFEVAKDHACIFASVVFGRRFSSWPLRALEKVLGGKRFGS